MTQPFDAAHPRSGDGKFTVKQAAEANLGQINLSPGNEVEPAGSGVAERFEQITSRDATGACWVETEDDWYEAERLRKEITTSVPFADLAPGDRFVVTEGDWTIEYKVQKAPSSLTGPDGVVRRFVDVANTSRGGSCLLGFTEGQEADTIPPPVHLRNPRQVSERELNEGWGV